MSKREGSKFKINRRLGVNLWGRSKSPLNRREYSPLFEETNFGLSWVNIHIDLSGINYNIYNC